MFLKAELGEPADEIWCEDAASRYTRPVPLDLLTQAAEGDDDADEQWRCLRRRLRRPPRQRGPTIRELQQAYEEATGTSLGCD
jgi:hypothetical protein